MKGLADIWQFIVDNWFLLALLIFIKPAINGVSKGVENGIAKRPEFVHEKAMEITRIQAQKDIQVDSYFREVSGSKMIEILEFWVGFISNPDKASNLSKDEFMGQMETLIKFASARSIKIFANMQQMSYQGPLLGDDNFKYLMYVCYLIAQLKEDFTGQKIDPLDLLRAKMNDYSKSENKWKRISKQINDELN